MSKRRGNRELRKPKKNRMNKTQPASISELGEAATLPDKRR